VADAVVVAFEMVEVAEQQSERVADLRGASHLLAETLLEVPLVVEAGEAAGDGVHARPTETSRRRLDDRRERLVVAGDVAAQLVGPVAGGSEIRADEIHRFTLVVVKMPL